ncbi:MAG TPA: GNAT family N-acetyltransferase [Pseudonocardiaceae bacterium]|jgi:GNAT superfamily N-acetyltransferase|nr:GNAT family N-acetyltransferase [Pseudonocardiaceae bacterium]
MELRELDQDTWPALERLFGPNGAVAGCWCTWFFQGNKELAANGSDGNREILRARLNSGTSVGLLAMDGDDARGWVAVAPRTGYPRLARSPVAKPLDPAEDITGIWSVTCFFVHRTARRAGLARLLLDGAVDHARRHGAEAIEGYPVDTELSRSAPIGSGELYHGTVRLFTAAGFEIVRGAGERRALVRLTLCR